MMPSPRTIDASLPIPAADTTDPDNSEEAKQVSLDLLSDANLPLPYEIIPSHVRNLKQCALHQIQTLTIRQSDPTIDNTDADADALDDGFVLCDLTTVQRKLLAWRHLFPRIKPFFALKCHPDPMVAAVLGRYEDITGYDCASIAEIRLALDSMRLHSTGSVSSVNNGEGSDCNNAKRCIYANPQRAERDLDEALSLGVECLVFDGVEELHKIEKAYQKILRIWEYKEEEGGPKPQPPELVLRILVPDSGSNVPLGEKFGAHPDSVANLTEQAVRCGLPVIGVSFHCGSGCHDPHAYGTALKLARDAIDAINNVLSKQQSSICTLVDIGGGYPGLDGAGGDYGRFSGIHVAFDDNAGGGDGDVDRETASNIADVVTPLVDELFPPNVKDPVRIIAEPGRYFVESAFALCMRIYSTRLEHIAATKDGGEVTQIIRHYYIAQGVRGVFKDVLLCGETFNPIPLEVDEPRARANDTRGDSNGDGTETSLIASVVHGPSGEDFDIVCSSCLLPPLDIGDWLIFDRMGAYTLSIAACSGSLPMRYVAGGQNGGER